MDVGAADRPSPSVTSISLRLGFLLAFAGGFLDAYTYVEWGGVFANSQTGNIVLFGVEAARGAWGPAFRHLPPFAAFFGGIIVSETLRRPAVAPIVRRPMRAALVLEILLLLVVGALPAGVPLMVVTVTVAFVAAVQISTFRTLVKWPYNTTMATGNLRSAAQSIYQAIADHDADAAARARAFLAVVFAFFVGALAGGFATMRLGVPAAWIAAGVLTLGLALFVYDERHPRRTTW